jgi:hypothetical protein
MLPRRELDRGLERVGERCGLSRKRDLDRPHGGVGGWREGVFDLRFALPDDNPQPRAGVASVCFLYRE